MPSSRHFSIRLLTAGALAGSALAVTATPALAASADLVVTKVQLGSSAVTRGHSLEVTDVTANQGNAKAGASATKYFLSTDKTRSSKDVVLGKRSVGALGAGKHDRDTVGVTIPKATTAATYHVIACADATKQVAEKHEGNNCLASGKVTVRKPTSSGSSFPQTPDPLVVSPTWGAATLAAGEYPNLYADQANDLHWTGPDGTSYALHAASGALPQTLVLGSVQTVGSLPGAPTHLVAGLRLEPTGVVFDQDVTLTITPAQSVTRSSVTGFQFGDVTGSTGEYALYPVSSSGPIVMHLGRTGTFGIGTSTATQRAAALAHPPTSKLAQVENVLGSMTGWASRSGSLASFPSTVAAADAYWSGVLKPALERAATRESEMVDATTATLQFLHEWGVLGGPSLSWEPDAFALIQQELITVKNHSYTRCVQDHTMIDLLRIVIAGRQLALLGAEGDAQDALTKYLKCGHFTVSFTDEAVEHDHHPATPAGQPQVDFDMDYTVTSGEVPLTLSGVSAFTATVPMNETGTYSEVERYTCSNGAQTVEPTTGTPTTPGSSQVTLYYDLTADYRVVDDVPVLKEPKARLLFQQPIPQPQEHYTGEIDYCSGSVEHHEYDDDKWWSEFVSTQLLPALGIPLLPSDGTGTMLDFQPPVYVKTSGTYSETNTLHIVVKHVPQ